MEALATAAEEACGAADGGAAATSGSIPGAPKKKKLSACGADAVLAGGIAKNVRV